MSEKTESPRLKRAARLGWIPVAKMKVNPVCQREVRQHWVEKIAGAFDPEQFGTPTVNERDGWFYIVDGQHRIEAFKRWVGDWSAQSIQCWLYSDLTEAQEAELFLRLQETVSVSAFDKFRVGLQARRPEETNMDAIARLKGFRFAQTRDDRAIASVTTARKVFRRGEGVFARTLSIIGDAFPGAPVEAVILDGVGLLCARYNGDLRDDVAIKRLAETRGGVNGVIGKAATFRKATGNSMAHCVAGAIVEIINRGGGKKLPSWWKAQAEE